MTTPKREPTLADRFLSESAESSLVTSKWLSSSKTALITAKKFVLDAQAAQYMGQMLCEHPRIVADAQAFG